MSADPALAAADRRRMFDEYAPLARRIAREIARGLPPGVDVDDMTQDGFVGLLDAILRCNREMTAQQFRSFADQRVRGAVLDGLRAGDGGSRRVRREMRRVEAATQRLGHRLGRAPTEGEVAGELGLALADYQKLLQEADGYFLLSLEDLEDDAESSSDGLAGAYLEACAVRSADPLVVLERAAFQAALQAAIAVLPETETRVVRRYYSCGMTMREIGGELGVGESRVCQIHAQAIARLRASFVADGDRPSMLRPRLRPRVET